MMSVLEQLLYLSKIIALLFLLSLASALSACSSTHSEGTTNKEPLGEPQTKSSSVQPTDSDQQDKTIPREAVALEQDELTDIEALLSQVKRVGPAEEQAAKILLREGLEARAKKRWGPAAKAYGEAAMYKPNTEALVGTADMEVIIDRAALGNKQQKLESKLRDFQGSIPLYRVTIELNERTNSPLSVEQRNEIEEKIKCLETFVKNPNPEFPICQLVKDALAVSKIN